MAEFLVLGAGMVGVSSALALQARGHQVTIVDRIGAGLETSYGNAGMIQVEAAEPYALPRDMVTLLKYAFEISNDVTWTLSGALQMAPALWSYFRHSSLEKHAKISHIHSQLTFRSTADHEPLIRDSESEHLISHCGLVMLHRDESEFEKAVKKAEFCGKNMVLLPIFLMVRVISKRTGSEESTSRGRALYAKLELCFPGRFDQGVL